MKKSIFVLLLSLCVLISTLAAPVGAESGGISDEEYLQQTALAYAQAQADSVGYDADGITLAGPYAVYVGVHNAKTKLAAYTESTKMQVAEGTKLFFVYDNGQPLFCLLMVEEETGEWRASGAPAQSLEALLAEKERLEEEFPGEEIGYYSYGGAVLLCTPSRKNGYVLLTDGQFGYEQGGKTVLISARDMAVAHYEAYEEQQQRLKEVGEADMSSGEDRVLEKLLSGKTYPAWKFWMPYIGFPAAVIILAAGVAVFLVKRKKKA